jgi:hypothetical protein
MKKKLIFIVMLGLVFGLQGIGIAGNTANQTVSFQVTAINEIAITGTPAKLIVNSATAGSAPTAASDATTTYAITTNENPKKITGVIDSNMPSDTTLYITLASGGTSEGEKSLSTSAVDLVTAINKLTESGKTITYRFTATTAAAIVDSSRIVTLTLTN